MEEKLDSNKKIENNENQPNKQKQGFFSKIMNFFRTHKTIAEILRFLIVGGLATIIDMVAMGVVLYIFQPQNYPSFFNVFYGATQSPSTISTVLGTGIGFLVGLLFNYIFSIIFVFQTKGNSKTAKGFLLFSFLSAIGLGIHLLGMFLGYNLLGINEWLVNMIQMDI